MSESCSARNIYCPLCRRKVGSHDGKSTIVKEVDCRKCNRRIVFDPMNDGKIVVKKIPPRNSSSGVTFR